MLVYDAVAGALPLLIISERYAFSPKFESECQGGYAAGNALRKYAEGFEMTFSTPAAHARVAGPEQERVALRTVADSGKPLPLQPFGSACPSTRSGYAVPCGTSLPRLALARRPTSGGRGAKAGLAFVRWLRAAPGFGVEPQYG